MKKTSQIGAVEVANPIPPSFSPHCPRAFILHVEAVSEKPLAPTLIVWTEESPNRIAPLRRACQADGLSIYLHVREEGPALTEEATPPSRTD
jgi:hypothetical protein